MKVVLSACSSHACNNTQSREVCPFLPPPGLVRETPSRGRDRSSPTWALLARLHSLHTSVIRRRRSIQHRRCRTQTKSLLDRKLRRTIRLITTRTDILRRVQPARRISYPWSVQWLRRCVITRPLTSRPQEHIHQAHERHPAQVLQHQHRDASVRMKSATL